MILASVNSGQHGQKCPTSAIGISPIFKADNGGVLDIRRLRITQKIGEITWREACCPLVH